MIDILDPALDLLAFVPPSIASDPEIVAMSHAINPELRAVAAAIPDIILLPRIGSLAEDVLDAMAWGFRLNELGAWEDFTLDAKREFMAGVLDTLKRSGTAWLVKRILGFVGLTGNAFEWWEEGADPYTYRFNVAAGVDGVTARQLLNVGELARRFTPKRSSLRSIDVGITVPSLVVYFGDLRLGAAPPPVLIDEIAVGDGNGAPVVPAFPMTALVHEIYRTTVYLRETYLDLADTVRFEMHIPANIGPGTVREIGLFASGELIAVASVPALGKPDPALGVPVVFNLSVLLTWSPASAIDLPLH